MFKSIQKLKRHELSHLEIKKFRCDWSECGKMFKTNIDLKQHKRCVHLKERRCKCDYNSCQQSFYRKSQLLLH